MVNIIAYSKPDCMVTQRAYCTLCSSMFLVQVIIYVVVFVHVHSNHTFFIYFMSICFRVQSEINFHIHQPTLLNCLRLFACVYSHRQHYYCGTATASPILILVYPCAVTQVKESAPGLQWVSAMTISTHVTSTFPFHNMQLRTWLKNIYMGAGMKINR